MDIIINMVTVFFIASGVYFWYEKLYPASMFKDDSKEVPECKNRCRYCFSIKPCSGCGKVDGFKGCCINQKSKMIICPICGNKRCPKAQYHGYACTGSNEPNQIPSVATFDAKHKHVWRLAASISGVDNKTKMSYRCGVCNAFTSTERPGTLSLEQAQERYPNP